MMNEDWINGQLKILGYGDCFVQAVGRGDSTSYIIFQMNKGFKATLGQVPGKGHTLGQLKWMIAGYIEGARNG